MTTLTIEEQERLAYVTGDTTTAALLARLDDMHHALARTLDKVEAITNEGSDE